MCGLVSGTVADNVRYGPNLRGEKQSDEEVYKLLSLADLDASFAKKTGAELSVGQAQRVALARTLANEPEVLLLDEPTSALDPISTENIEDVIVKLKKQRGITTVIVSHSIKQIQKVLLSFVLLSMERLLKFLNRVSFRTLRIQWHRGFFNSVLEINLSLYCKSFAFFFFLNLNNLF